MTKRRVKSIYKYFEKRSDELPTAIMETFVACLRGKGVKVNERGMKLVGPLDVEYYLRKHNCLMVACNKIKPEEVDRSLAAQYLDVLAKYNYDQKSC